MTHSLPRRSALSVALLTWAGIEARAQEALGTPVLDVPYVPTPQEVVRRMLELARVGRKDVVYDLGCGDGRIVIAAARERGARGVGIDLDPRRITEAKANARAAKLREGQVEFRVGDLFETDLSEATVVTLYLLPEVNLRLRPQLWRQLRAGSRVVSHAFDMGPQWPPDRSEIVSRRRVYYWTITQAQKAAARRERG